jgi:hypothetical protein
MYFRKRRERTLYSFGMLLKKPSWGLAIEEREADKVEADGNLDDV